MTRGMQTKHTEASRKLMSQNKRGSIPWNKGKKGVQVGTWKNRKRPERSGENHHWWKGGVTEINQKIRISLEYKLWRRAVFERDKYTCIWCGARNGKGKSIILNADHIKPFAQYPELRFAIDNGRTLCKDCHKKTSTYGRYIIKS